ncbi:MAG: undecaprenol kinase [Acidimicrobiaceae bacterium]|nr:undecaprenol kinase [Acidimicrobiaceae bacterium]MDQ1445243.1 undecaprenol kinase [Acidimicrobiaceae bacterium]
MVPAVKDSKGLRLLSFRYAFRGVRYMVRREPNMRFHLVAATGVLLAAAALRLPLTEWSALVFAITLVLLGETLNTAIEAVLDIVQPEHHDRVGVVKDLAAGAVLVASAGSVVIAGIVFVPRVWDLLT